MTAQDTTIPTLEEVGETNSAAATAQTLRALQDDQRQFLEKQKQLLVAFTGLTDLISTALQNDKPQQIHAKGKQ